MFFQLALLAGYTYAHVLSRFLAPRQQAIVHFVALFVSLAFLPIVPSQRWQPTDVTNPEFRIVALLLVTIGIPYILLSSSAPLLQRWFTQEYRGTSPYRLYALSNLGSLLGLSGYVFVVEPVLGLQQQAKGWSMGYALFVVCAGWCAYDSYRRKGGVATALDAEDEAEEKEARGPSVGDRLLWLGLAACGSVCLLAITNQITQYIAPIPLLWILPLSLYLTSFIICFDHSRWYQRRIAVPAFLTVVGALLAILLAGQSLNLILQIVVYSTALFVFCMVCHGELAHRKPVPRHLTGFYLLVASGGAAGGLFTVLVAPRIFDGYWELHLGIFLTFVLFATCLVLDSRRQSLTVAGATLLALVLVTLLMVDVSLTRQRTIAATRNFYGTVSVTERDRGMRSWRRYLYHGGVLHGGQLMREDRRLLPTTYYGPDSGLAMAIRYHPRRHSGLGLRIGVVGLGTGTIAAYTRAGDSVRFYEINPAVVEISESLFTYRKDMKGQDTVVLGDARIALQRELARDGSHRFDVLVVDAFSSDSVPTHLLTREAFDLYWRHLKPDGILVVQITAIHLDLSPVVRGPALESGRTVLRFRNSGGKNRTRFSDWILVVNDEQFMALKEVQRRMSQPTGPGRVWTDDHSNMLDVIDVF